MRFLRMALFLLLPLFLFASEKKTICLSMIVKDEKPVILKCLASVRPYIDHWIIIDTGSKDGTQEAIREFMKDIPGQLYERPWVDFAHNRNEALELSRKKGDYSLIIDADNILTPSPSFKIPPLTGNLYAIPVFLKKEDGSVGSSLREFLVPNQFSCRWEGVIHETLQSDRPMAFVTLENIVIHTDMVSGHRSQDPKKYLKDAELLKKALIKDPNHCRYQFLLGASYELANELELALKAFDKCSQMKGCPKPELYRSLFQIGVLQERLGNPAALYLKSYEKAYRYCSDRAEPLFFMANHYTRVNEPKKAYELLKKAVAIPLPLEEHYVERSIYTWASLYNLAIVSETLGKIAEADSLFNQLLLNPELPLQYQPIIKQKLSHYLELMEEWSQVKGCNFPKVPPRESG